MEDGLLNLDDETKAALIRGFSRVKERVASFEEVEAILHYHRDELLELYDEFLRTHGDGNA